MITKLEVSSPNAQAPALPMGNAASDDPIQVLDVKGLEPVKAEMASTAYATGRGEYFQGSSTGNRNILVVVGLNPDWQDQTMASLRKLLYGYFMPELQTDLRIFSDDYPVVDIQGMVESCEPVIFSQDPQMTVSILNHDPDFVDPDPVIIKGEVPASLSTEEEIFPTEYEFIYEGSIATGFELRVRSNPDVEYNGRLVVVNRALEYQVFDIQPVEIEGGQWLVLRTHKLGRGVEIDKLIKLEGYDGNILKYMDPLSSWPQIRPGRNVFSVGATEPGLRFELIFFNKFGAL